MEAFVCQRVEMVETVIPLLDPGIVHTGGKVIHPGNTCLTSLNLSGDFISELISSQYWSETYLYCCNVFFSDTAGNKLTEQSLKVFLSSLEGQGEGGLLRLSLNVSIIILFLIFLKCLF